MKIIVIDTSHNASLSKTRAFLHRHMDASRIYTFDCTLSEYACAEDLLSDLEDLPEEFFTKPCAYYDMASSVFGRVRKMSFDSIIIYSPGIDECSRLSSEYLYDLSLLHFQRAFPGRLYINYSALEYALPLGKGARKSGPKRGFSLKGLWEKLSAWEALNLTDDGDYDDYYSAG